MPQRGARWACRPPCPLPTGFLSGFSVGVLASLYLDIFFSLFAIYSLNRVLRIYLFIFIFSKSEIICEPQSSAWVQVPRPASVAPRELPAVHLRWLLEWPEDGPFPPPLRVPLMQTHKWPYSKMTANTWRNVVLLQSVTKSEASRPYLVQFWFLGRSLDQFHCLAILYPDPVTTPGPVERALAHLLPGPVVQEPCSGLVRRAPVGAEGGQGPCRQGWCRLCGKQTAGCRAVNLSGSPCSWS